MNFAFPQLVNPIATLTAINPTVTARVGAGIGDINDLANFGAADYGTSHLLAFAAGQTAFTPILYNGWQNNVFPDPLADNRVFRLFGPGTITDTVPPGVPPSIGGTPAIVGGGATTPAGVNPLLQQLLGNGGAPGGGVTLPNNNAALLQALLGGGAGVGAINNPLLLGAVNPQLTGGMFVGGSGVGGILLPSILNSPFQQISRGWDGGFITGNTILSDNIFRGNPLTGGGLGGVNPTLLGGGLGGINPSLLGGGLGGVNPALLGGGIGGINPGLLGGGFGDGGLFNGTFGGGGFTPSGINAINTMNGIFNQGMGRQPAPSNPFGFSGFAVPGFAVLR